MGRKIAFLLAVFVAVIAAAPNWYGQWQAEPGVIFGWSGQSWDSYQYYSFMRTGYRGDWLMTNLLTSEPHRPVFLMPFYVALGHVASWYRDFLTWREGNEPSVTRTIPVVYHNARVILTFVLFLLIYRLTGQITVRRSRRLWIMAFAAFANGVWWGQVLAPESNVLSSSILFPNFTISLIFIVCAAEAFIRALKRDMLTRQNSKFPLVAFLLAALAGTGLAFIHPFDIPPLALLVFAAFAWAWLVKHRFPRMLFATGGIFALFAAIPLLYQKSISWRIAEFRMIEQSNIMPWESWWTPLAMMEAYLFLALLGLQFFFRRRNRPQALFVVLWVLAAVGALFIPLSFQRRMIEGLPLALAFALPGVAEGFLIRPLLKRNRDKAANPRRRIRLMRHATYGLILLVLLPKTLWTLYDRSVLTFTPLNGYCYIFEPEIEAFEWLSRNSDWRDAVWASYWRGNRAPFLSGNRVFFGHNVMTAKATEKELLTRRFFAWEMDVSEFRRIVREYGIRYLLWTEGDRQKDPEQRDIGTYDPETLGKPVFDNGYARIYRLEVVAER